MSWLDTLEDIRNKDFSTATAEDRDKTAREVVNMGSYACAVVAVSPIPFSDAVLMLPVQSAMVMTIGHVYGRQVTQAVATDLLVEVAATAGAGMLARQGIKALLPVVGALLTVPAAFAANWAIGRAAIEYFKHPGATREQLKKVYESARAEGSSLFSKENFEAFRTSMGAKPAAVDDEEPQDDEAAESDAAPEAEPAPEPTEAEVAEEKERKRKKRLKLRKKLVRLVEQDFAARIGEHRDVREALDGVVHLDITGLAGGQWTVDFTAQDEFVTRGLQGTPLLTVRCGAKTFVGLVEGKKSAQQALADGQLELDPMDLDLAMKLGPLFRA